MARLLDLPLLVILMGLGALAMLVPALHGFMVSDYRSARAFFYSAALFSLLTVMIGIATAQYQPRNFARSHLAALLSAYLVLPVMLAVPFHEAVRDTTFLNAWFEMVSSFTTTGATLFDTPGRLAPSVHLWRALVGWFGGAFILLAALAILAPLNLGGFEVATGAAAGRGAVGTTQITRIADPAERLIRYSRVLFPVYGAMTLVLWIALLIAGETPLVAACHAMSTLATSGISPVGGLERAQAGIAGEALILLALLPALSRRAWPAAPLVGQHPLRRDPEVRIGLFILLLAPTVLFLRHWFGAIDTAEPDDLPFALRAAWGSIFTTLSFLSTNGFVSADWAEARVWSGLRAPGLILLGLAVVGGGVATTAGGVKLLRVYALGRHAQREMERLIHPASIGGAGPQERRLRREGAQAAWVFFMLFAASISIVVAALALTGLTFEPALILTIAALSTTGPLAAVAGDAPLIYAALSGPAKAVLAGAMVLGRLEALAIIALFAPVTWRN
ncbi:TrkH family potassium uptake protein [Plastorhodobacter daqingensis]|uniref:TrkH family potassium uptake protein n=1 Tax=Plastorhodobacter daqingensis TaxID=1387281 RepID=A0ABW2UHF7_9RHOB